MSRLGHSSLFLTILKLCKNNVCVDEKNEVERDIEDLIQEENQNKWHLGNIQNCKIKTLNLGTT